MQRLNKDPMSPAERALQMVDNIQWLTRKYNKAALLETAKSMGVPIKPGRWTKTEIARALVEKQWEVSYL